jgi:hypothetical protein
LLNEKTVSKLSAVRWTKPAQRQPGESRAAHLRPRHTPPRFAGWRTRRHQTAGFNGSSRSRSPVSANSAFVTTGAIGGVPGSPTPPGARGLGTMCVSMRGVAASVSSG